MITAAQKEKNIAHTLMNVALIVVNTPQLFTTSGVKFMENVEMNATVAQMEWKHVNVPQELILIRHVMTLIAKTVAKSFGALNVIHVFHQKLNVVNVMIVFT